MSFFSSNRERRLWGWTLVVLGAVYLSFGVAQKLAALLPSSNWNAVFFLLGCFLVLGAVVSQGLKMRPSGAEISVALGVAAAYLMVFVRMTAVTERSHLVEYSVVAVLIYEALLERASQGRRVPAPALLALVVTSLIGVIDEGIQAFLPNRVFDPVDMLFNFVAAVLAIGASLALGWARRRARRSG